MGWGFVKGLVKPLYRIGNTAVNAYLDPVSAAYGTLKWVDPTGTVEKIDHVIDNVIEKDPTGILSKYGGEAVQIGTAILSGNPEAATDVLVDAITDEVWKRAKSGIANWATGESPHPQAEYVVANQHPTEYSPHEFNNGSYAPQLSNPYNGMDPRVAQFREFMDKQIAMMQQALYMQYMMQLQAQIAYQRQMEFMMMPKWYWSVVPNTNYIYVVCPFFAPPQIPPHNHFVPYPIFLETRGKWSQCGYCGNWSFTP